MNMYRVQLAIKVTILLFQKSLRVPLNIFPFALKVHPRRFLHFSNNLGLFLSSSKTDAIISALGISRPVAI
jgi:hypothetical protein